MQEIQKSNIFVSGFGRCGTTAMMHMLWNGDFPTATVGPSFEDQRLSNSEVDLEWLQAMRGKAVKWLDPINVPLPSDINARTIFMRRNPSHQVRSQLKLISENTPYPRCETRRLLGQMRRMLERDTGPAISRLKRHGPVLVVHFEHLLKYPETTAQRVAEFLPPSAFSWERAAQGIIERSAKCAPDLSLEASLVRAWDELGAAFINNEHESHP